MKDWGFAQTDASQELAQLHFFSLQKHYPSGQVEFVITMKEFVTPKEPAMIFLARRISAPTRERRRICRADGARLCSKPSPIASAKSIASRMKERLRRAPEDSFRVRPKFLEEGTSRFHPRLAEPYAKKQPAVCRFAGYQRAAIAQLPYAEAGVASRPPSMECTTSVLSITRRIHASFRVPTLPETPSG